MSGGAASSNEHEKGALSSDMQCSWACIPAYCLRPGLKPTQSNQIGESTTVQICVRPGLGTHSCNAGRPRLFQGCVGSVWALGCETLPWHVQSFIRSTFQIHVIWPRKPRSTSKNNFAPFALTGFIQNSPPHPRTTVQTYLADT